VRNVKGEGHVGRTEGGVVMSTFHDSSRGSTTGVRGWNRTRWLVVTALLLAVVVAIVLLVMYTGGGGGGGGGGGY
jgi:hypothetical protein